MSMILWSDGTGNFKKRDISALPDHVLIESMMQQKEKQATRGINYLHYAVHSNIGVAHWDENDEVYISAFSRNGNTSDFLLPPQSIGIFPGVRDCNWSECRGDDESETCTGAGAVTGQLAVACLGKDASIVEVQAITCTDGAVLHGKCQRFQPSFKANHGPVLPQCSLLNPKSGGSKKMTCICLILEQRIILYYGKKFNHVQFLENMLEKKKFTVGLKAGTWSSNGLVLAAADQAGIIHILRWPNLDQFRKSKDVATTPSYSSVDVSLSVFNSVTCMHSWPGISSLVAITIECPATEPAEGSYLCVLDLDDMTKNHQLLQFKSVDFLAISLSSERQAGPNIVVGNNASNTLSMLVYDDEIGNVVGYKHLQCENPVMGATFLSENILAVIDSDRLIELVDTSGFMKSDMLDVALKTDLPQSPIGSAIVEPVQSVRKSQPMFSEEGAAPVIIGQSEESLNVLANRFQALNAESIAKGKSSAPDSDSQSVASSASGDRVSAFIDNRTSKPIQPLQSRSDALQQPQRPRDASPLPQGQPNAMQQQQQDRDESPVSQRMFTDGPQPELGIPQAGDEERQALRRRAPGQARNTSPYTLVQPNTPPPPLQAQPFRPITPQRQSRDDSPARQRIFTDSPPPELGIPQPGDEERQAQRRRVAELAGNTSPNTLAATRYMRGIGPELETTRPQQGRRGRIDPRSAQQRQQYTYPRQASVRSAEDERETNVLMTAVAPTDVMTNVVNKYSASDSQAFEDMYRLGLYATSTTSSLSNTAYMQSDHESTNGLLSNASPHSGTTTNRVLMKNVNTGQVESFQANNGQLNYNTVCNVFGFREMKIQAGATNNDFVVPYTNSDGIILSTFTPGVMYNVGEVCRSAVVRHVTS